SAKSIRNPEPASQAIRAVLIGLGIQGTVASDVRTAQAEVRTAAAPPAWTTSARPNENQVTSVHTRTNTPPLTSAAPTSIPTGSARRGSEGGGEWGVGGGMWGALKQGTATA